MGAWSRPGSHFVSFRVASLVLIQVGTSGHFLSERDIRKEEWAQDLSTRGFTELDKSIKATAVGGWEGMVSFETI